MYWDLVARGHFALRLSTPPQISCILVLDDSTRRQNKLFQKEIEHGHYRGAQTFEHWQPAARAFICAISWDPIMMTVNYSEKSQNGYQNLLNIFEADTVSWANGYQLKYVTFKLISSQLWRCLIIFDMFFEIFPTSESVMRAFRAENCVDRAPRPLAKWPSISCQSFDYRWCPSCHSNSKTNWGVPE